MVAESPATVLAGAVIPIAARASGGGRLLGSVGPADVAEAIKAAKGVEVEAPAAVLLPEEHIKETGSFEVTVELFHDVATIVTWRSRRPLDQGDIRALVGTRMWACRFAFCVVHQSVTNRALLIHTTACLTPHLLGPYHLPSAQPAE